MNLIDEYRNPRRLQERLEVARRLATRRWTIMDVCGGQTHSMLRYGLEGALADCVECVHGPGCPVCVTPAEVIDAAIDLSLCPQVLLTTFGDMLRVPGKKGSLMQARAAGGQIRMVYSPCDAVQLARRDPDVTVVFLAVGFETTAPTTALAVLQAQASGLENFAVLAHHVRVEPAMRAVAIAPSATLSAFLAAGHVCTVTGYESLEPLAAEFQLPVVVTGFEPLDLMEGIIGCLEQLESGRAEVDNRYARCVRPQGNPHALRLIDRVFAVCDLPWRGFGVLPQGGFTFRGEFSRFDARQRFGLGSAAAQPLEREYMCATVLTGSLRPPECTLFGTVCTPENPQGAPMVSSEGACAAYYRYAPTGAPADV